MTDSELLALAARAHGGLEYVDEMGWIHVSPDGTRGAWWNPLTDDGELYDLGQAVDNLIQDRNDYCATEDGNAEFVKRLQALLGKVEGVLGAHYQR